MAQGIDHAELRRLEAAATPGPWHSLPSTEDTQAQVLGFTKMGLPALISGVGSASMTVAERDATAELIVVMRNNFVALLDENERLRGALFEISERSCEDGCAYIADEGLGIGESV